MKTNGARFLENLGIPFELREYEVDPEDLSATTVAKKIGMPAEQVFKTLIITGGPNIYRFAVIPGDAELDFKKLARAAGLRKAEMVPLKDVQPLTGYIRGGVTIFGARKPYPVYIDETAILFDKISVSAGARGTQLILRLRTISAPHRPLKSKCNRPTSQRMQLAGAPSIARPGPTDRSSSVGWLGARTARRADGSRAHRRLQPRRRHHLRCPQALPVYIDETAILFDKISVSAGACGTQLILAPSDYLRAARRWKSKCNRGPHQGRRETHPAQATEPMTSALWTHLVKDLRIEWRSREAVNSMLFFALLVVVLFSLAFSPRGAFSQEISGGVICVATLFASMSALNQAWAREIRHQVLDAQRMAPTSGAELFLAKVLANFFFVSIVQLVLAPVFLVFYNLRVQGQAWHCCSSSRSAPGPWSPTEPSSLPSPSAAATANSCSRSSSSPSSCPPCWPWSWPPAPSSPATATPSSGSSSSSATTSSSPPSASSSST